MGFLQLFSVLLVFGLALASLTHFRRSKETHWLYWGIAFSVYCVGLIFELALGFAFNEHILRFWYWLRYLVWLPVFALGLLRFLYEEHPWRKYVEWGVWLAVLAGFGLTLLTAITEAVDWYDATQTIYIQYGDLLARNRPTRWLTILINGFGLGIVLTGRNSAVAQKLDWKQRYSFLLMGLSFVLIFFQDVLIEEGVIFAVWVIPILGSTLLFIGCHILAFETTVAENQDEPSYTWLGSLKWHHLAIALVLLLGLQLRLTSYGDPALSVSNYDTGEFIRAAERDLFSVEFFTSNRPATIVLLYKLLEPDSGYELTNLSSPAESIRIEKTLQPGLDRIVIGQMWLAILSWSVLAVVMARRVENPFLKFLIVVFTLGFAYSPNLADWDSILLSESIALSLFALMVAATLELVPRLLADEGQVKPAKFGILVIWAVVMVFWVFSRDTNSYILLVMLATIASLLILPHARRALDLRLMLLIGLFLVGLFVFQNRTLATSDRWVNPFFNNMLYNVFPYPERVAYFEQQGMPITEEVLAFRDGPPNQDGFWEIPYLMEWVYVEGYSTYSRFLITHPTYTVQKVFGNFPLVFLENAQPFFPADFEYTPRWFYYLGNLLHPLSGSVMLIVVLLASMLGWQAWLHQTKDNVDLVGIFGILVLGLFAMLAVSILGDGLSIIRHAMVAVVPFRLFMWLLAILVIDRLFLPSAAALQD